MSDDLDPVLLQKLEAVAHMAEVSGLHIDDLRVMPAPGVPDIVYESKDRIQELEAKLAKAVEALNFYATLIGEKHECPWHMLSDDYGEKARNTLADLTGGKDE